MLFRSVYASFWGPNWTTDPAHLQAAGRLSQFLKDLIDSNFMNILSQYGVGFGRGSGAFIQSSFVSNVAAILTDDAIHGIIQTGISLGLWPDMQNTQACVMVFLDETIGIDDQSLGLVLCEPSGDTAFGYHNYFTTTQGNPFYYAMIPYLSDGCLTESCGAGNDFGCSLHLYQPQLDRQTQVASHEFAEMTTDPELNAWYDQNNGEIGDICNGETDYIIVGPNTWAVQPIYDKYQDANTNGVIYCTAQVDSAEPAVSGGPLSRTSAAAAARMRDMASWDRYLPLPAMHMDAKAKTATLDNQSVQDFVRKAFYPMTPGRFVSDFPGLLHKLADGIAAAKL